MWTLILSVIGVVTLVLTVLRLKDERGAKKSFEENGGLGVHIATILLFSLGIIGTVGGIVIFFWLLKIIFG